MSALELVTAEHKVLPLQVLTQMVSVNCNVSIIFVVHSPDQVTILVTILAVCSRTFESQNGAFNGIVPTPKMLISI